METTTAELPTIDPGKWYYDPMFESTKTARVGRAAPYVAPIMLGIAILSMPVFCVTMYLIHRLKMMHISIKIYLLSDILCRLLLSLCLCLFSACLFDNSWFCVNRDGDLFSGFRVNNYVSCLALALQKTTIFFQLMLALNRFFAIYFDGKYFEAASNRQWLQILIIVSVPIILFFIQCSAIRVKSDRSIIFGGPLFDPRIGGFLTFVQLYNEWRQHLKSGLEFLSFSLDMVMLSVDLCVFWRASKRRNSQSKAERRLLTQILMNHFVYFLSMICSWVLASRNDPFLAYAMVTLVTPFWNIVYSLVVAYFVIPPKTKERVTTVQESVSATRSTALSSRITK